MRALVCLLSCVSLCGALSLGCAEGGDGHAGHGKAQDLGTQPAGSLQVSAVLYGELEPGREIALDLKLSGPRAVVGVAVRLADADGQGTLYEPVPRVGQTGTFHGHLPVPDSLPAGALLWVRVSDDRDERHEARFALP